MNHKILIVDDDPGVCNSLAMLLRCERYQVDNTTDSSEALVRIKNNQYDVCIFDYKMKGLHGIDLLKVTKAQNPQCPVLIISAMLNINELCKKELKSGMLSGVISKPFVVDELLRKIKDVINGVRSQ
ncbi:MAG: response regulator [Candidatus Omnitrophica bacterium]|nr:response regulator [Candidatus Omnitrophota bacterium]